MSDLAKVEPVGPISTDIVVMASTPTEMVNAQSQLLAWFVNKIEACKAELKESEENLELAKSRKLRTAGWASIVDKNKRAVSYYEKAHSALTEGYCIVPDFPIDIIAIRTSASKPRKNYSESTWGVARVNDQVTNSPEIGKGEYVSPQALVEHNHYITDGKEGEKPKKTLTAEAIGFLPPDFPYKLVKPRILDDMGRAMALKIFDEIGVVRKPVRSPDPIVVGRVIRKIGNSHKTLSFLISWWVDSRDL